MAGLTSIVSGKKQRQQVQGVVIALLACTAYITGQTSFDRIRLGPMFAVENL